MSFDAARDPDHPSNKLPFFNRDERRDIRRFFVSRRIIQRIDREVQAAFMQFSDSVVVAIVITRRRLEETQLVCGRPIPAWSSVNSLLRTQLRSENRAHVKEVSMEASYRSSWQHTPCHVDHPTYA